jgi:hypothetical protein
MLSFKGSIHRPCRPAESIGRGIVWSFIVYHHCWHAGFEEDIPYNVAMIQLEEGPIVRYGTRRDKLSQMPFDELRMERDERGDNLCNAEDAFPCGELLPRMGD